MPKSHLIEKREGETPLQALERFRADAGISKDIPMTYAGRLDPMASGVLLILIGDECKKKEEYLGLKKEYEFEVLCGIETDTGDILGLPEKTGSSTLPDADIQKRIEGLIGEHALPYPDFSSKKVEGKHLFEHALEGTLGTIEVPTRQMMVQELHYLGMRSLTTEELLQDIVTRLDAFNPPKSEHTGHDFRKEDIKERWKQVLVGGAQVSIARFRARVSAGTYIRALAPVIASTCGTTGLAYSIRRTRIGNLA